MGLDMCQYVYKDMFRPADRDKIMDVLCTGAYDLDVPVYFVRPKDMPFFKKKLDPDDYKEIKKRIKAAKGDGIYLIPWW